MLRGLVGVVPNRSAEAGRFYMSPGFGSGPWLFQCIQSDEPLDGSFRKKALVFTIGGAPDFHWSDIPDHDPLVALDDVHVRIDPTSISGSAYSTSLRPGTFLLDGDAAVLCVPNGAFRGWALVNITAGRLPTQALGHNWLAFDRWSLVMDDEAGDELTIASFGYADPEAAGTDTTP